MDFDQKIYTTNLLLVIQEEFEKLISEKNSWGKNELLLVMEKVKTNAILRMI